jgi:hypothetical protein
MMIKLPDFKQPSTWQGLAGILASFGVYAEPELLHQIITLAGAVISIISLLKNEKIR